MTTENVNSEIDFNDEAVAAVIEGDDHLRTLPLDSEDLKAAVAEKMATMTEEGDAPAGDEGNEDADESDEETSQEEVKKPNKGWSKRVEKLVAANHDKERRIRELELQLTGQVKQIVNQAVGDFEYDKPEPVFEEFDTIAAYSKAVARWEYGRIEAEKAYTSEVQALEGRAQSVKANWEAKQVDARNAFDDFDEIVTVDAVQAANPSQMAKEFLAESDIGPTVIYHMLADGDLVEEFAKATAGKQVKMLAKVEAQLEGQQSEKPSTKPKQEIAATKKPMKLPSSLPKGRPTAQGIDLIRDADRMSDAEWSKAFESQRRMR